MPARVLEPRVEGHAPNGGDDHEAVRIDRLEARHQVADLYPVRARDQVLGLIEEQHDTAGTGSDDAVDREGHALGIGDQRGGVGGLAVLRSERQRHALQRAVAGLDDRQDPRPGHALEPGQDAGAHHR